MKVFKFVSKVVLCLFVIVIAVMAMIKMQNRVCNEVSVEMHYNGENLTVSDNEVKEIIQNAGIETIGLPIKEIVTQEINAVLAQHPYVKSVNRVYFAGTVLKIELTLKDLLLHVYASNGSQYFVDTDGGLLPFSTNVIEKLILLNGNVRQSFDESANLLKDTTILNDVFELAHLIRNNDFYSAQFKQIYINNNQEIELIPTVGNHVVLFGNGENSIDKLNNIYQTYKKGLVYMGMDRYCLLDLRYKNKVIAKKRY